MSLVDTETGEILSSLADLEAVIDRGIKSFVEVGEALLLIRDERLYRQDYDTFEDYCRERWGFSGRRAGQLIGAAEIVGELGTMVPTPPTHERQARALAPLKAQPEQMAKAWAAANDDGTATAS